MTNVNGVFERRLVLDRRGSTDNTVSGFGNTVSFRGDKGANTFSIRGAAHNVDVNNLGKDDHVLLQGPGWQELPDANSRDGVVRYYNRLTGSFAEVRTDDGRNDNFVRARVHGANHSAACGCWGHLGHMDHTTAAYMQGLSDGHRAGRVQGRLDAGNWFAMMALGPLAWFA